MSSQENLVEKFRKLLREATKNEYRKYFSYFCLLFSLGEEAYFVLKSYQIFCEYLASDKWKILGQEQDGFVLSWDSKDGVLKSSTTKVGFVDLENNILKVGFL
jgi:hypothetical protein